MNTNGTGRHSSGDRLIGTRKVCDMLDCSDRTLRRWVAGGKFPPPDRKIGRTLRWRASTVNEFIKGDDE